VTILDCANVNTSFPGFATLAAEAGLKIEGDPLKRAPVIAIDGPSGVGKGHHRAGAGAAADCTSSTAARCTGSWPWRPPATGVPLDQPAKVAALAAATRDRVRHR